MMRNNWKWLKPWHVGTHLRVLSESYPMNTNVTGFRWFSKILLPCALDESSLSIGRVTSNESSYCADDVKIGIWYKSFRTSQNTVTWHGDIFPYVLKMTCIYCAIAYKILFCAKLTTKPLMRVTFPKGVNVLMVSLHQTLRFGKHKKERC